MNISNYTDVSSLDEIQKEYFREKGIPGVIFLSILSIFGAIGNIHILLVYKLSKQMAKRGVGVFILWLSAMDLIACIACMPFEIVVIRLTYTFGSSEACKFFRFLTHTVSLSSLAFLAAIAIHRYRMVNLSRQTAKPSIGLNKISLIIVGICTAISVPIIFFYGADTNYFLELNGADCIPLSKYQNIAYYGAYGVVVISIGFSFLITCSVCYGKLLYAMYTKQGTKTQRNPKDNIQKESSVLFSTNAEDLSEIRVESKLNTNNVQTEKLGKRKEYEKGRQLTIGLITATAISFTGFVIFVLSNVVGIAYPALSSPADNILSRAFFINNAANSVVFFSLDGIFREECLRLYKKRT